ncbi:MAG: methionyl-tRNA formyltransferase [Desulfobacterota bacterium]|nr:methionyl-tRNA formyltransferase [Thermodesulfobacteriota bacterium]
MKPLRIVFFGTPTFAVPTLRCLIERRENIIAVITQPDRRAGRGRTIVACPVKEYAVHHGIPVLQPEKVNSPEFLSNFKALNPDLAVVVAYGQIFSQALLDIPCYGFINVHASLLPAYRGPAPINWAIINGDTETGVTIMKVSLQMDAGDILLQEKTRILTDDDARSLHDRLADIGARLLGNAIDLLYHDGWKPQPQDHSKATYAPMLKKEDGCIEWTQEAQRIERQIRGMTPWPGCYTFLEKRLLKIHRAQVRPYRGNALPGTIVGLSRNGILTATGRDALLLTEVQLEGKKRMHVEEFLRGHVLQEGMRFMNTC